MRDLKYLAAYIIPATAIFSLTAQGWWSYSTVIFTFGLIPLLDPFWGGSKENLNDDTQNHRLKNRVFDWLLYLNVPILYSVVAFFLWTVHSSNLELYELTGLVLSVGIVMGACGINVAHELGHRVRKDEQMLAKVLLLPALYMHFFIEHNRGHHKHVATPKDPATARYGESVYAFWLRSVVGSYLNAWRIETKRLKKENLKFWSLQNEMLVFQLIQAFYLITIALVFSPLLAVYTALIGIVGFLLLETINYIEHYGLQRTQLPSGRYERVQPKHSWNANHELGRIILYELTRHSDHHFLATKKYQVLDHHEESPQLQYGYPTSMLMALFPPLWFKLMNKRLEKYQSTLA